MTVGKINISDTLKSVESTLREDKSISPQVRVMMELLVVVINLLLGKLGLNSKNSSTPPSKDPKRQRGSKRKAKGEKRRPGGQKGQLILRCRGRDLDGDQEMILARDKTGHFSDRGTPEKVASDSSRFEITVMRATLRL